MNNLQTVREALEFYANEENYGTGFITDDDGRVIGSDESKAASDEGHRARQALAALDQMSWQTIDTAPKDGVRVLLFNERYGAGCGHFYDRWYLHFCLNTETQPTHWMPLPQPPADGGR